MQGGAMQGGAMPPQLYSVEQVADLLGLHVKTVRTYVRDGRLKAVRIGKQYRIARDEIEALTGHPVAAGTPIAAQRHAEASTIVQIDAINPDAMSRLVTMVMAAAAGRSPDDPPLRIETSYQDARASLKIILLGDLGATAELLRVIDTMAAQP